MHASAHALGFGRATPQGHSAYQSANQSVHTPQRSWTGEQTHAVNKHNSLSFLIGRTNKVSRKQGAFGHRAILVCGGRDVARGIE